MLFEKGIRGELFTPSADLAPDTDRREESFFLLVTRDFRSKLFVNECLPETDSAYCAPCYGALEKEKCALCGGGQTPRIGICQFIIRILPPCRAR